MAMVVMAIIIILNIALLLAVMRVGTMGEHHDEIAPQQSAAVRAWRARLAAAESDAAADRA